ncbi:DUF4113 domain-containing protein (plasmid) [Pantoea agglomerans]|jgi:DNA polymerase V|uniref:DUF4113 domain-containing protein n=2 Tax=Enterobacter agglomerans TaxID=549 RepID=UPI00031CE0DA|nr:DUF4113 domain-containing protein [Pantoea agglomerans]MDF2913472.1 translesion error-prone polymerase subunit UmuC [Pantoea agglomerans]WLO87107.1 DUF4113 domain-containing protein [Pantoea agglomerans]
MLADFYQSGVEQFDMFSEQQPRANSDALMAALDGINRPGKGKVWFAGQGNRDSSWQMKRGMLSPRYTTRIKDIPGIK